MAKRKTTIAKQLSGPDTALLAAVRKGNFKGLRAALEKGANPDADDEQGTALAQAVNYPVHCEEMVLALMAAGADLAPLRNALVWAVNLGNADLVRKLIEAGADLNIDSLMGTPLARAAQRGHAEIADALIAAGADVNAGAPLVAAIKERHSDIACRLIEELNRFPVNSGV
jgi:ankyrin repeat protein